ncbi:cytochrome P450, partial [Streptomyces sp. 12297]
MTSDPETVAGPQSAAQPGGCPEADGSVHFWSLEDLEALDFDPFLHDRLRETRAARIRLPYGKDAAWLMSRYEDVKQVTSDPRFSREELVGRTVTSSSPHAIASLKASLNYADPPRLNVMRRVVARAFTGKSMLRLRPTAQRTCDGLLDGMERQGAPADLVEHLHGPFPLAVVSDLLGVPDGMRRDMTSWADMIMAPGAAPARSSGAKTTVRDCVVDLLALRREEPQDDLGGVLAAATEAG